MPAKGSPAAAEACPPPGPPKPPPPPPPHIMTGLRRGPTGAGPAGWPSRSAVAVGVHRRLPLRPSSASASVRSRRPGPAPRRRGESSRATRRGSRRPRSPAASSRTTRSASEMVDRRWAMIRVVRPSIWTVRPAWIICSTWTSMALVASSSTMMGGLTSSVRAMAMRWRWPPDKV